MAASGWPIDALRTQPELALFLALAIGFAIGPVKLAGFSLGNVTATLLAAVLIGQLGIEVPGPIKATFFLLFLFAVGYGVGPQFFRGLGKEDNAAGAAILIAHHLFRFHPALLFGICAGVRTTTAALGMIQEAAKSKVPALGYGMPYAVGNTLLTIFGMVIVLLMVGGT